MFVSWGVGGILCLGLLGAGSRVPFWVWSLKINIWHLRIDYLVENICVTYVVGSD